MRNSTVDVSNYDCQGISFFEGFAIDASSFTRFAVHQKIPTPRHLPGSLGSFQTGYYLCHSTSFHPYCWL
jgi:hypothetical protein